MSDDNGTGSCAARKARRVVLTEAKAQMPLPEIDRRGAFFFMKTPEVIQAIGNTPLIRLERLTSHLPEA
ncbi:MAG: hypothetical protein PVF33_05335, partial [Candidatus Latescibacterota bacterium]